MLQVWIGFTFVLPLLPCDQALDALLVERSTSTLQNWANINSGSENLEGISQMVGHLKPLFEQLGFTVGWDLNQRAFTAEKKTEGAAKSILLVGHLDTVFEKNHAFQETKHLSETQWGGPILSGPGVADAKGGIVLLLELIRLSQDLKTNWKVFLAADEEVASPKSRAALERFASGANLALVFEPGWYDEELKGPRLPVSVGGNAHLVWKVHGIESHTGTDFKKGRSAIKAIAEHILHLENLNNDPHHQIALNVADVLADSKLNVRPGYAELKASIRFREGQDEHWLKRKIADAKKKFEGNGIKIEYDLQFRWLPQEITKKELTDRILEAAKQLGQPAPVPSVSLARSASSFLATLGIPTLDSMGPYGKNYHSDQEQVYMGSFPDRLRLLCKILEIEILN